MLASSAAAASGELHACARVPGPLSIVGGGGDEDDLLLARRVLALIVGSAAAGAAVRPACARASNVDACDAAGPACARASNVDACDAGGARHRAAAECRVLSCSTARGLLEAAAARAKGVARRCTATAWCCVVGAECCCRVGVVVAARCAVDGDGGEAAAARDADDGADDDVDAAARCASDAADDAAGVGAAS